MRVASWRGTPCASASCMSTAAMKPCEQPVIMHYIYRE